MNMLSVIDHRRGDHLRNPYPLGFQPSIMPEGQSGDWRISKYTVDEREVGLMNLRLIRDGQYRRIVPPGSYTRLTSKREGIVMSDTPGEAHEHRRLYRQARGHVLLNGLGLGWALETILRKSEVERITVIERSPDVIALVAPHVSDDRVEIIEADALEWRPAKGVRFDVVWHDIWATISQDNKEQMTKLRRAYGRRTAWQSCWSEEYAGL